MQRRWVGWVVGVVVFLTIGVAAAVLIVYGVTTHDEPGLLRICRIGDRAVYVDDLEGEEPATCADALELRWPREAVPLAVRVFHGEGENGTPPAEELRVVEAAVADFNSQVGFELFTLDRGREGVVDVSLVLGAAAELGDPPGECRHRLRGDGRATAATVVVRNVPDDATLFRVLLHELGHAAGLAHDDWTGSLMNRRTLSAEESELPAGRLTDSDRAELRELYLPR